MIRYLLRNKNTNDPKVRESKEKFRKAWQVYQNGSRTYKNGKQIGTLITNGMFVYSEKPDTRKASYFSRGFKNGIKASVAYWIPGIAVRHVGARFQRVKGIQNIHKLFKNNTPGNNRNAPKGPRTAVKRSPGRTAKYGMVRNERNYAYSK
jgi:hypothetical protein